MKTMSGGELAIFISGSFLSLILFLVGIILSILSFFLRLMRGQLGKEEKTAKELEILRVSKKSKISDLYH